MDRCDEVVSSEFPDEESLKKLECPFTWEMDVVMNMWRSKYAARVAPEISEEDSLFPILCCMSNLMYIFIYTNERYDYEKISKYFDDCQNNIMDLKESLEPGISLEVLQYVIDASKCFVYKQFHMYNELKLVLARIKDVNFTSKKDQSTLLACKSMCWLNYYEATDGNQVEIYIRQAIAKNDECHVWFFTLARILRRNRRTLVVKSQPSQEEMDVFYKAYDMSRNPIYEVHIALLLRENKESKKALELYRKIFYDQPEKVWILTRIALGLMNLGDLPKAKTCLEKASQKEPNNSMTLHYCAIYYMKMHEYDKAKSYFEKAMGVFNLPAERQYVVCMLKINEKFDVSSFLIKVLDKYESFSRHQLQPIILDLAVFLWKRENDVNKALHYFHEALEIDPFADCFIDYSTDYLNVQHQNVYSMLDKDFIPRVKFRRVKFSQEEIGKLEKLESHCKKYFKKELARAQNSFSRCELNS